MNGIGLSFDGFKGTFFDKKKVMDPAKRAIKKAFGKFGAYTRQRAKTSLRYSDKSARPGEPPHAHKTATRAKTNKKTGLVKIQPISLLREYIFFGWEEQTQTIVIGPALLRNTNSRTRTAKTIPELMEYGGDAVVTQEKILSRRGPDQVPVIAKSSRTARYAPHGFTNPAADKETPTLMEALKDSVK